MKFCPNEECPYYLEHGFVAEYEDNIKACLDCDAQLVDEQPVFELEESADMSINPEPESGMVILKSQLLPTEAHILRGRLEAEGIPAFVADEHVSSFYLPTTFGGARLMVRKRDLKSAAQILGEISANDEDVA